MTDERDTVLRLRHGTPTEMAVAFADVVCDTVNPQVLQLRLKGTVDGQRVRLYLPWSQAQHELAREQLLADVPVVAPGSVDSRRGVAVALLQRHLRIAMEADGQGRPVLRIVPRRLTPAEQARDARVVDEFIRALQDAHDKVGPVFQAMGRQLRNEDLLDVAGRIFYQRARG